MPVLNVLRLAVSVIFALIGLVALAQMAMSEGHTAKDFLYYFQWALSAGIVFVAVGLALTAIDREDKVDTDLNKEQAKR